ncbi:MAG: coenzyme F420-0:L-glutamate ligase, partial [Actinomycetales bacterium]
MPGTVQIVGIHLAERVQPGVDLFALLREPLTSITWPDGSTGITDGDLIVVTSKIVAKAEGRILPATERDRAIDEATVRTIAVKQTPRGATKIVQTQHGLVLAAAGIDASNTADGTIVLLPVDPDSSAAELARQVQVGLGVRVGVIITDTLGRPWRLGLTDVAIGAAGIQVLDDYTDRTDAFGRQLETTVMAIADEVASAA